MTAPPSGGTADQGTRNDRPEGRSSRERSAPDNADGPRRHTTAPPPSDLDTEAALLGALLLGGRQLDHVLEAGLTAHHFYSARHGTIYHAIGQVAADGLTPDVQLVAARLERRISPGDLVALLAAGGNTGNARAYAQRLIALAERRRTLGLAIDLANAAREGHPTEPILARLEDRPVTAGAGNLIDIDLDPILDGTLEAERPLFLTRTDTAALLYPGRVHDIHAEPAVGKTWIGLTAIAEVLAAGGTALYLDYEDRPAGIIGRLRTLGVDPTILRRDAHRFRYIDPTGPIEPGDTAYLDHVLDTLVPDIAVIDGVAIAIARQGLSENSNDEVNHWADLLPRRIARTGTAVLLLDHVVKATDGRARGARGAGAKLAIIDGASYNASILRAYSTTEAGAVRLKIAKDRPGNVGAIGTTAAIVTLTPGDGGLTVTLDPPAAGPWRPTYVMAQVSKVLEREARPMTATALADVTSTKRRTLDRALEELVDDGYVTLTTGRGGHAAYSHRARYHDPEDRTEEPDPHDDAEPEGMF